MPLPKSLKDKILKRFDTLIEEGQSIYDSIRTEPGKVTQPGGQFQREIKQHPKTVMDDQAFQVWEISFRSLLDHVLPQSSIHRRILNPETFFNSKHKLEQHLAALKAIRTDFELGFLEDITLQIEAEIASDYMGQAENLLSEGKAGQFDHVPAAVLSGAVLEKALRRLCREQTPQIPTTKVHSKTNKKKSLTLSPLINELQRSGLFNDRQADQLRVWAKIRNAAAHGEFEKFDRSAVEQMLPGIRAFLASHMT